MKTCDGFRSTAPFILPLTMGAIVFVWGLFISGKVAAYTEIDPIVNKRNVVADANHGEPSNSMIQLLHALRSSPPQGNLSLSELGTLLRGELSGRTKADPSEQSHFAERIVENVRRLVGDGPFNGDTDTLRKALRSLQGFGAKGRSGEMHINGEVLAALLALSFYDTSTTDDHRMLYKQLVDVGLETIDEIMEILKSVDSPESLSRRRCLGLLREMMMQVAEYIENPLFPSYKFPLSSDEIASIRNHVQADLKRLRDKCTQLRGDTSGEESVLSEEGIALVERGVLGVLQRFPTRVLRVRLPQRPHLSFKCTYRFVEIRFNKSIFADEERVALLLDAAKHLYLGCRYRPESTISLGSTCP